jgi:hypothetical protein
MGPALITLDINSPLVMVTAVIFRISLISESGTRMSIFTFFMSAFAGFTGVMEWTEEL